MIPSLSSSPDSSSSSSDEPEIKKVPPLRNIPTPEGSPRSNMIARGNSLLARVSARRSPDALRIHVYQGLLDKVKTLSQELIVEKTSPNIMRVEEDLRDARSSLYESATIILNSPHKLEKMITHHSDLVIEIFNEAENFKTLDDDQSQQLINDLVKKVCQSSESKAQTCQIVCELLRRDVARSENEITLLRSNTIRTKLYTAFQTEMMKPIFQQIVEKAIKEIKKSTQEYTPRENVDIDSICFQATWFIANLKNVLSKVPSLLPQEMVSIYRTLGEAIQAKYPEANINNHIASFLFLRGLNPAFVSPKRLGLAIEMTTLQSKNILAVSIAIQDVVNNATELKGKWDDQLKLPKNVNESSFVETLQPILAQLCTTLRGR